MTGEDQSGNRPGDVSPAAGTRERTFLGGLSLGARSSLFALLGVALFAAAAVGLQYADRTLEEADARFLAAVELQSLTSGVERDIWRIRSEMESLPLNAGADDAGTAAIQEHLAFADGLGARLDRLYRHPAATAVSEQVSTLREAVAQYAEQFRQAGDQAAEAAGELTARENAFRQAMRDIGKTLAGGTVLSLDETLRSLRAAARAFMDGGGGADLAMIHTHRKEFAQLLTSVPLDGEMKTALEEDLARFQSALGTYAEPRLLADRRRGRVDEILSYMTPGMDAITGYADGNLSQQGDGRRALRGQYRLFIGGGVAGAILLLLLGGLVILRSVARPLTSAAGAARSLSAGDTDIAVSGLANEDETGDIARAFWALKTRLAGVNELQEAMKKAKADAERGHAASAEAEWLRRDLESMKVEADKGREALAEVALLRKIVDATADSVGNHQATPGHPEAAPPAAAAAKTTDGAGDLPLDTISSISRKVAQSSETVTAAADEAERTGALIRNLTDAADRIDAIEELISHIGEQADMLVVAPPPGGMDRNLVLLKGDGDNSGAFKPDAIGRRFDAIRSAAGQANWAVRDIAALVRESKDVALEIARLSSAEALEVTTDLLQQSENLRGMLDKLVNRMQDQIAAGEPTTPKRDDGPTPA